MTSSLFEAGLSVIVTPEAVIQQDQFDVVDAYLKREGVQWPIYVVGTCPRVVIVDGSIAKGNDGFILSVNIGAPGNQSFERHFHIQGPPVPDDVELISRSPFRVLTTQKDGQDIQHVKISDLLRDSAEELRRIRVCYIGQAVGDGEDYTVINRLSSHSTLQQIYFDVANNEPHLEVCIIPCSIEPYYLGLILPNATEEGEEDDLVSRMRTHLTENTFPDRQLVNLGEAALIRHFQPRYNSMYTKNFPDEAHVGYKEAYLARYNAILAELCGEEMDLTFYNDVVSPMDHVLAQYSLLSEADRISMLDPKTWFFHYQNI